MGSSASARPRLPWRASGAGAVAGLALWFTQGALDRVPHEDAALRVALLPPLWKLLVAVAAGAALSAILVYAVARLSAGRRTTASRDDADVVLPLYGTAVLALPYLPHLADWWPALTVLAGPFALVIWAVTAILVGRAIALRLAEGRTVVWRMPRATLLVALVAFALYGAVAVRLTGTGIFPGGDEPHYLVVAQSLWRDGDLRIENNHRRGDTLEYFPHPLAPHYLVRGVDREIYSIHPLGLSLIAAPVYAAGGYPAVVLFVIACATAAGTLLWSLARQLTSPSAATFAWLACALGAPFVFNSFTVYPEIPAALAALAAYAAAIRLGTTNTPVRLALACSLLLATLPWLSSKYALMVGAIGLIALTRLWRSGAAASRSRPPIVRTMVALAAPVTISVAGWMAFHYVIWGSPLPSVVYGSQRPMRLEYLWSGVPGLLFDQEYGIVAASPALLIALAGLAAMLWQGGTARRLALEVLFVFVALLIPVGAFHIWWGGTAAIGRPVIAALLFLALPIAWAYQQAAGQPALRAACWVLVGVGLTQVAFFALAQKGLLIVGSRDGMSRLLEYWSPSWRLWALAPAFITQPAAVAAGIALVWLAASAAAAWLLARVREGRPGRHGLLALGAAAGVVTIVAIVVPAAFAGAIRPDVDLAERSQSEFLRGYDAAERPLGIVYAPFAIVPPERIPPLFTFTAGPDPRGVRTPVPLLHDARWSIPAGTYRIELAPAEPGGRLTGELAAQVGRAGRSFEQWQIETVGRWTTTFTLPVDARFFGFRASRELAAQRARVTLQPLRIADRSTRDPDAEVVQSRRYGDAALFFHDDLTSPEETGFWTRGDSVSRLSVAVPADRPRTLRFRSGPVRTSMRVRLDGRATVFSLGPHETHEVPLPSTRPVIQVEIRTDGGFVPARLDPANGDTRLLGCWVEIAG